VTFPWNSPVRQHEAEHGITGVFGLTFRDGPDRLPVIESVAPDSPAARQGLRAGMPIIEINGMNVASQEGLKTTPKELAADAVLGIDKLALVFSDSRGEVSLGPIDDPPSWQTDGSGLVKIYGLEIAGSDGQEAIVSHVRRQSPEAAAGIRPGQRVQSVSNRPVETIGELRQLLEEHRQHPWLSILPAGYVKPVRLSVDRPLPRSLPVHPTQLYSTIDALILCFLLLVYDRFRRRDGELTAIMMTVYPVTRFLIERIRTDEAAIWNTGLHISQNISLGLLVVAVGLWIYILRRPARLAFGGEAAVGKPPRD
jgi:membrane-associated protease RseP (regulator of RpoE activity)